ncbi:MAG: hypothetical protein AAF634_18125, partial [Bacteroidota bacterium]
MIFQKTNIENKLSKLRDKKVNEEQILQDVYQILEAERKKEEKIAQTLASPQKAKTNEFDFDALETHRIYHVEQLKKICIDYRLRFLDSKYFKGQIPNAAFSEIKRLEEEHGTTLKGFKIMAPSKLFKLEDKDDPLLFAPIGNGYYYLIHKWGNDLHPLRKVLVWPFKSVVNLGLTTLLISYFATILVPNGLFSKENSSAEFWMMFFFMFKSIAAVVIFYGFALGKNFNPVIWNSKYFNA